MSGEERTGDPAVDFRLIGGGLKITIEYPSELERTPTGKVLAFFRRPSLS